MHRWLKFVAVCAVVALAPAPVAAAKVEIEAGCEIGGGPAGPPPNRFGLFCPFRLRLVPEVPLALEVSVYVPYGAGAGYVLDIYRGKNLRIHFLDLGIFFRSTQSLSISHPEINRLWDLTVGAGLEYKEEKTGLVILFDWRAFLPDPTTVPFKFGTLAAPFYLDALKGGQLWFGIAWQH